MKGEIDTSFETLQRDLFASGIAATIGMNAFGLWIAIKTHADYNTGECWPGMRRLGELTGLSTGSIHKGIKILLQAKLLRIVLTGVGMRTHRYVARERLDIRLGQRVLATIVVDYVPVRLPEQLDEIKRAFAAGKPAPELTAQCEIIPGDGFEWDAAAGLLRTVILPQEWPQPVPDSALTRKVQALQQTARQRRTVNN